MGGARQTHAREAQKGLRRLLALLGIMWLPCLRKTFSLTGADCFSCLTCLVSPETTITWKRAKRPWDPCSRPIYPELLANNQNSNVAQHALWFNSRHSLHPIGSKKLQGPQKAQVCYSPYNMILLVYVISPMWTRKMQLSSQKSQLKSSSSLKVPCKK